MDGRFAAINPFRPPNWRQLRVIELQSRLPFPEQPGEHDDEHVDAYYRFWSAAIALDGVRRKKLDDVWPETAAAHRLYYSADIERRQILEALLLTNESWDQIAARFETEPAVIDCYEKLFFAVRDRMHATMWIHMVIRGDSENQRAGCRDAITVAQRGMLYRLFAYSGGPMVLDAIVSGVGQMSMPRSAEEVPAWLDTAIANIVRNRAVMAAQWLEINRKNAMQLIRLSIRLSAKARKHRPDAVQQKQGEEREERLMAALRMYSPPDNRASATPAATDRLLEQCTV